jgi:hypothetical protein
MLDQQHQNEVLEYVAKIAGMVAVAVIHQRIVPVMEGAHKVAEELKNQSGSMPGKGMVNHPPRHTQPAHARRLRIARM